MRNRQFWQQLRQDLIDIISFQTTGKTIQGLANLGNLVENVGDVGRSVTSESNVIHYQTPHSKCIQQ
jgi:hypothetical protein